MNTRLNPINQDFRCIHCGQHISTSSFLSGVVNRNHCPYCLYSRHVDHFKPGDRLAACKGPMQPVGLTVKKTGKKYAAESAGELMLIHRCVECGKLSLNRIAADDIPEAVLEVFELSFEMDEHTAAHLALAGIAPLRPANSALVHRRLFGEAAPSRYASRGSTAPVRPGLRALEA